MKKKWQDVKKCNFAIKVTFREKDVKFTLYDRNDNNLFTTTSAHDEDSYVSAIHTCCDYADKHHGNEGEWIYIHNPFFMDCKDIKVG